MVDNEALKVGRRAGALACSLCLALQLEAIALDGWPLDVPLLFLRLFVVWNKKKMLYFEHYSIKILETISSVYYFIKLSITSIKNIYRVIIFVNIISSSISHLQYYKLKFIATLSLCLFGLITETTERRFSYDFLMIVELSRKVIGYSLFCKIGNKSSLLRTSPILLMRRASRDSGLTFLYKLDSICTETVIL